MNLITSFLAGTDIFTISAVVILIATSVFSWAIIISKYLTFKGYKSKSNQLIDAFEANLKLDELVTIAIKEQQFPVQELFLTLIKEFKKANSTNKFNSLELADYLNRSTVSVENKIKQQLESGMGWLASIGATAPFVGLLGTVTGVVKTLFSIGFTTTNIQFNTAAPGLSSALIATAIGLFVAIPAVIMYNYYRLNIKKLEIKLQNFQQLIINKLILTSK